MRRKVALYVAGRKVDIGDDTWILYNWTRENLANPTAVINSSSHQVQLPGTCRNNSALGSAFRLDRKTVFGVGRAGTEFDPMRKTPFTLYDADGSVLEAGYCRLDAVDTRSRLHSYTLTLYGGLGSFFYALAMNEDGSARTLADLIWKDARGQDETQFYMQPLALWIKEAWDVLRDGYDLGESYFSWWWNVINFAPCYNGLPKDFDTKHAISSRSAYGNVWQQYLPDPDSPTYTYKAGLDCALLTFANAHTEWETCDLRWYLQRPVVSVKALVAACCDSRNNGGYTVTLDPTFFRNDNPVYADAWITLPLIAKDYRDSAFSIADVLRSSKAPMKYLVDYCKTYGLLFLWDGEAKTVRIVTRATFYGEGALAPIDLTDRVDRSQPVTQTPVLADKRWYQLGDGGKGEFVEQYKRDYGKGYAIQRIDTGYEFDAGTTVLTDGMVYQDTAEVQESDLLFASAYYPQTGNKQAALLFPAYEEVSEELWNGDESISVQLVMWGYTLGGATTVPDVADTPGLDWLPKVQLHGADGKAQDGADVLLVFSGLVDAPQVTQDIRKEYRLTNDSAAMTQLAGGPCWDMTRTGIAVTALPSFRRVVLSGRYIIDSYDWGVPAVRPVPGISYPSGKDNSIYGKWWKAYLSDRYASDTCVVKCMADLRGLPVGQALLRRFFWLDGSLWSMNAIRNHSLTSWDLTEVELVRVHDRSAYDTGPGSTASTWLDITPDAASLAFISGGETLTLTVRSSSAWTLALSALAPWLTFSANGGAAGTTVITVSATANDSGDRRSVTVGFTGYDGAAASLVLTQEPVPAGSVAVSPNSAVIPGAGGQASTEVTATGAWDVDSATVPAWLTVTKSSAGITVTAEENTGASRLAQLKVYLTGDTTIYALYVISQEQGTGGTGGITLLDGDGNDSKVVGESNGTLTLYVDGIPANASWVAVENVSWASLSQNIGTGPQSITVTFTANTGAARQVAIAAQRDGYGTSVKFYLHQEAAGGGGAGSIEITRYGNDLYNDMEVDASANSGCACDVKASGAWTAATSDAWIHPLTNYGAWSGSGNKTLWFDVDANTGSPRTGTIVATLTGTGLTATFYVIQEGDNARFLSAYFMPSSVLPAAGATVSLVVNASAGLAWTIDNVSAGLTPASLSGTGPDTVSTVVAANTGAQRTLTLKVKNTAYGLEATATLIQGAPEATDYLRVTPFGTINVPGEAGVRTFSVESSQPFFASCPDADVTVSPTGANAGIRTVTVRYPANPGVNTRNIVVTFTPAAGTASAVSVTIAQAMVAPDSLTISMNSMSFTKDAGAQSMGVSCTGNWAASTSDSWIRVTPASGGSGDGQSVVISVTANIGPARSGYVIFSHGVMERMVTVTQASGEPFSVYPSSVNLGAAQGSEVSATVFAPGRWSILDPSAYISWLLPLPDSTNGGVAEGERLVFRAYKANDTGASRTATVRLGLDVSPYTEITLTVTQAAE